MPELSESTASAPFREALVDLGVVRANAHALTGRIHPARLVADLGADAFGHGALGCARAVVEGGATAIVVSSLAEAVALHAEGIGVPVACPVREDEYPPASIAAELVVVVRSAAELARARAHGSSLALVIDTGVGMPGLALERLPREGSEPVWVMADLGDGSAGADGRASASTALGAALEQLAADGINIAAVLALSLPSVGEALPVTVTAVCVGPELFGVSERTSQSPSAEPEFAPAMTLWAPVVAVKRAGANEGVSYGHTYVTSRPTSLALVSLGYGDGLDRAAGNLAPVWVGGQRFTITGRMAMDAHVVDVGPELAVSVGDPAVLFGDAVAGHPHVSEWAVALGTSSAEITTRLTDRVRRTHR